MQGASLCTFKLHIQRKEGQAGSPQDENQGHSIGTGQVRLQEDIRSSAARGLEGKPQEGGEAVPSGRIEPEDTGQEEKDTDTAEAGCTEGNKAQ